MRRTEPLSVVGYADQPRTATATIASYDAGHRMRRALRALGISWAIGVGCVFIPVAHFVLVPAAFLIGVVLFLVEFRRRDEVLSVSGPCPDCGVEQQFEVGTAWNPPFVTHCRDCGRGLEMMWSA